MQRRGSTVDREKSNRSISWICLFVDELTYRTTQPCPTKEYHRGGNLTTQPCEGVGG